MQLLVWLDSRANEPLELVSQVGDGLVYCSLAHYRYIGSINDIGNNVVIGSVINFVIGIRISNINIINSFFDSALALVIAKNEKEKRKILCIKITYLLQIYLFES